MELRLCYARNELDTSEMPEDALERWDDIYGECTDEATCATEHRGAHCRPVTFCEATPLGSAVRSLGRALPRGDAWTFHGWASAAILVLGLARLGLAIRDRGANQRALRRERRASTSGPPIRADVESRRPEADDAALGLAWAAACMGALVSGAILVIEGPWGWRPESDLGRMALVLVTIVPLSVAPILWLVGLVRGRRRTLGAREVRLEGSRVHVGSDAGARVRQGLLDASRVVLALDDGRELRLRCAADDAARIGRDLGLLASEGTHRERLRHAGIARGILGAAAVGIAFVLLPFNTHMTRWGGLSEPHRVAALLVLAGLGWLLAWSLAAWAADVTLVIGDDGILVRGARGGTFAAWQTLSNVSIEGGSIVLERRGERSRIVALPGEPDTHRALAALIEAHYARARWASDEGRALAQKLRRDGREIVAWRDGASALLGREGDVSGALRRADAVALVLDPSASAELRVGAALAVGASADPASVARAEGAVRACASPVLRAALETALSREIDAGTIERALAETAAPSGD